MTTTLETDKGKVEQITAQYHAIRNQLLEVTHQAKLIERERDALFEVVKYALEKKVVTEDEVVKRLPKEMINEKKEG